MFRDHGPVLPYYRPGKPCPFAIIWPCCTRVEMNVGGVPGRTYSAECMPDAGVKSNFGQAPRRQGHIRTAVGFTRSGHVIHLLGVLTG